MPFKLVTGTKPSVSHLRVSFYPCVLRKATAHFDKKALNMRHQVKKSFRGIFVGTPQHQKIYLVHIPSTRKIIYSYDFILVIFSSALAYTSQPYVEAIAMCQYVSYIPCATSSKEQTGDIITFA